MLLVNFGYGTLVLHRIREKVVAASEPWTAHSGNRGSDSPLFFLYRVCLWVDCIY